jgi:hypothetical protein
MAVRRNSSMKVDSLDELKSAFEEWRRRKRHVRESMPQELLARARRATKKHGVKAVVRVTRVERARLFRSRPARVKAPGARGTNRPFRTKRARVKAPGGRGTKPKDVRGSVPTFSRLEVSAPSAPKRRPVAEVETSGVTLRVFEPTPEMMELLSAVCGFGGVR